MTNYKAKIHLKSGKTRELSGYAHEFTSEGLAEIEVSKLNISEDILDYINLREIKGIKFYVNGKKQKESPPLWLNGKGHIFSEKGLERTILPEKGKELIADYYANEDCEKLDESCNSLTEEMMEKMEPGKEYQLVDGKLTESKENSKSLDYNLGYNDFLSGIVNPYGLEHGYDISMEGTYAGHRIFMQNSVEKNPLMKRIFRSSLCGAIIFC